MKDIEAAKGEIVMYQPDETIRLEVRMGEETVWLTQQQMADLFDKDRTVIGRHIRNIYKEQELEKNITCAKFAHMGSDGDQEYEYTAYNLDVIISESSRGDRHLSRSNRHTKVPVPKTNYSAQGVSKVETPSDFNTILFLSISVIQYLLSNSRFYYCQHEQSAPRISVQRYAYISVSPLILNVRKDR